MTSAPNLILIITDQQRFDSIRALGYPYMHTPRLDQLVSEGTAFTHAFAAGASCVPSRASLFTGQFPHTLGVLSNKDPWRHSWIELLNDAGYHCVNIGKMHTVPFDAPCGFHERYIVENKERRGDFGGRQFFDLLDVMLGTQGKSRAESLEYRDHPEFADSLGGFEWPLEPELHHDVFVGNLARWWLREHRRRRASKKPVFLQIGFPGPHPPYDPLASYLELYRGVELPLPVIDEEDLASQPQAFKQMREKMVRHLPDGIAHQIRPSATASRRQRAHYYANVSMIDTQVGQLMDVLREHDYLENAVVVFTSDHGDVLSEHGQCTKWTAYEPAVRVPMIFWGPGRVVADRKTEAMVQLMDIGPTLLEFAAVPVPKSMQAISVAAALRGESFDGRAHVYCEHGRDLILEGTSLMTMVRSTQCKLVHFTESNEGQLFDLLRDPLELRNRWNDPDAAPVKSDLLAQLFRWRMESAASAKDWSAIWR